MTLRARAQALLAVVVVAFMVLGGVMVHTVLKATQLQRETTATLYPARQQMYELQLALADMERGLWGYVFTQDPAYLATFQNGRTVEQRRFESLVALLRAAHPSLAAAAQEADGASQNWVSSYAQPLVQQAQDGESSAAQQATATGPGPAQLALARVELNQLSNAIGAEIRANIDQVGATNRRLAIAIIATGFVTVLITLAEAVGLVRWVIWPLDDLRRQMRRLSRHDDTTTPLRPSGPPEITALGENAEILRQHLVSQIDATDAADRGLAQEGPAVAALRSVLRGPDAIEVSGWAIAVAALASGGALAADWWDVIEVEGAPAIEMSDITGHDAEAGVVAARFKAALHAGLRAGHDSPSALQQAANVFRKTPQRFASYVVVRFGTDDLHYLNAGHNPPVLSHHGSRRPPVRLTPTGPLVMAMGGGWDVRTLPTGPGDVLVMYTDGLVEARDAAGEELGEERVQGWADDLCRSTRSEASGTSRAEYIAHGLLDRARIAADLGADDVTLIVAVRR